VVRLTEADKSILVTGEVATDGALKGRWRWMGRTGWGAQQVALTEEAANGCTCAARPNAEVRRRIRFKLEDIGLGPDGIEFGKVKAHRTDAQLQGASAAERLMAIANRGADAWVGEGAASGGNEPLAYVQKACKETAAQVRFALNFQAELAERVISTQEEWPDMQPPPPRGSQAPRIGLQLVVEEGRRHEPSRRGKGGWVCQRCGKRGASHQALTDARCEGHAAARLPVRLEPRVITAHGHHLWPCVEGLVHILSACRPCAEGTLQ
ncbi:unnamed protein product, partial [Prorocentrum cordatum]